MPNIKQAGIENLAGMRQHIINSGSITKSMLPPKSQRSIRKGGKRSRAKTVAKAIKIAPSHRQRRFFAVLVFSIIQISFPEPNEITARKSNYQKLLLQRKNHTAIKTYIFSLRQHYLRQVPWV
jgi:hypothetical protein